MDGTQAGFRTYPYGSYRRDDEPLEYFLGGAVPFGVELDSIFCDVCALDAATSRSMTAWGSSTTARCNWSSSESRRSSGSAFAFACRATASHTECLSLKIAHGRPRFAKFSMHDGSKEKIGPYIRTLNAAVSRCL